MARLSSPFPPSRECSLVNPLGSLPPDSPLRKGGGTGSVLGGVRNHLCSSVTGRRGDRREAGCAGW